MESYSMACICRSPRVHNAQFKNRVLLERGYTFGFAPLQMGSKKPHPTDVARLCMEVFVVLKLKCLPFHLVCFVVLCVCNVLRRPDALSCSAHTLFSQVVLRGAR